MISFYSYSFFRLQVKSKAAWIWNKKRYKNFFSKYRQAFDKKNGFEVGGPSSLFLSEVFPVYHWANRVDGCNFNNNTLWEGDIKGHEYRYMPNKAGTQYILDGTDLNLIKDEQYDFVLSSHCLEHIANPLKALKEWCRILKHDGFMVLILPDKKITFDRRRAYTSFDHLLSDYASGMQENDLSHLPEILELHDLKLDPDAGMDRSAFRKRGENNFINRALHHHVFSWDVLEQCFRYSNVSVIARYFVAPFHQIIIGKKES